METCIQYTNEVDMQHAQERELQELQEQCKTLKKTKGINKKEIEARIIQMEFDIRAKHREEENMLESYIIGTSSLEILYPSHKNCF